jgi:integrase
MIDKDLCRNVINQRVGRIKRIFRWAAGEELLPPSVPQALSCIEPLKRGRSGARETEVVRPVSDESVAAILQFLPPTVAAMVQLQRLTGMRSGEVCRLRTCDVDTTTPVWSYGPTSHKTAYRGHERIIRIGPKGQEILRPWLCLNRHEAAVFSPRTAQYERINRLGIRRINPHTRMASRIDGRIGEAYNSRSYHRALRYAMQQAVRAGVMTSEQFWHPHQLRHRHATDVRQSRGLEAARVLLGHRTLNQTLEYAEADAGLATSVARDLG